MSVNNINIRFKFGAVPGTPCNVQFDFLDQGGLENLRVNGAPVFEADLEDLNGVAVAPGVVAYVSTMVTASGLRGRVLLDGPVEDIWVGGQEFFLDDVRTVCETDKDCDHVSDHESLAIGTTYGGCIGMLPNDLAFVEDGIPVHVSEFVTGGPVLFNCASIVPPFTFFGKSHIANLNNITFVYDFASLDCEVGHVSFQFADLGGIENFSVNGAPLYVGDLPAAPVAWPPDVTLNVAATPIAGGVVGEAILEGTIQRMRLGGQEFWVDNVCAVCSDPLAAPGETVSVGASLAAPPNPFRSGDTVRFSLDADSEVNLAIYDVRGALVTTLEEGLLPEGNHERSWDGMGGDGTSVGAGTYFVRLRHERGLAMRKIVIVR